jgi:hypothetical protein
MNMKPSPLRHLDISDDARVADMVAEKARELIAAYERIEELQNSVRELLWLIEFIGKRQDISPEVREALTANHRIFDAKELLS